MNLFSPCWFSHGDRFRERDTKGKYWLVCQDCGDQRAVLPGQKLKVRREKKPRKKRSADVLTMRKVG